MSKKYLTVKEAAEFLEVSALTLRNWDNNGKLHAYRHPINKYRLYSIGDLEKFLAKIHGSKPRKINVRLEED